MCTSSFAMPIFAPSKSNAATTMAKKRKKGGGPRPMISGNKEPAMEMETVLLPQLPDELNEDIFLRLPVKSVAAARCVSPSWNNLLSSPEFADRYHATSNAVRVTAPTFVTISTKELRARVFSGAVLLGRPLEGTFYLRNPSTGGALLLPPRRHPPWCIYGAGLGYDACARKHKAVLLEELGGPEAALTVRRQLQLQCRVVTVGAGQCRWRAPRGSRKTPIVCKDELVCTMADADPVFADGHLHWMVTATGARTVHSGILSFILTTESFRRLPLPPFAVDNGEPTLLSGNHPPPVNATLSKLDGHLCFVRDLRCRQRDVALFEVWMLRDIKGEPSWSLDRRIDLTPHVCKKLKSPWDGDFFLVCYVAGAKSSGERNKILMAITAHRAYVYEPDSGELRFVGCRNGVLVLYQESLVPVPGIEYGNKDIKIKFMFTRPPGF